MTVWFTHPFCWSKFTSSLLWKDICRMYYKFLSHFMFEKSPYTVQKFGLEEWYSLRILKALLHFLLASGVMLENFDAILFPSPFRIISFISSVLKFHNNVLWCRLFPSHFVDTSLLLSIRRLISLNSVKLFHFIPLIIFSFLFPYF